MPILIHKCIYQNVTISYNGFVNCVLWDLWKNKASSITIIFWCVIIMLQVWLWRLRPRCIDIVMCYYVAGMSLTTTTTMCIVMCYINLTGMPLTTTNTICSEMCYKYVTGMTLTTTTIMFIEISYNYVTCMILTTTITVYIVLCYNNVTGMTLTPTTTMCIEISYNYDTGMTLTTTTTVFIVMCYNYVRVWLWRLRPRWVLWCVIIMIQAWPRFVLCYVHKDVL
jgi:hypothetical protein